MTTINLKDYYPWYLTNEYIEVTDEVAEALMASKRAEAAHAERVRYNRAYYSLDCDDGIEYSACVHEPSPVSYTHLSTVTRRPGTAKNIWPSMGRSWPTTGRQRRRSMSCWMGRSSQRWTR